MKALATLAALTFALSSCGGNAATDAASTTSEDLKLPTALAGSEFTQPITKDSIRSLQTWIDDPTFEIKWTTMLTAPIEFFGGSDSAYYADLATLPARRLPGAETMCHGDPKLDNFGWTVVDGQGVFSDNDFDDAGYCPVAADALRYLVATDLWFGDPKLDAAALDAYVATVKKKDNAVAIDPKNEPDWDDTRTKGLAKDTKGDAIVLGGEVQAATAEEIAAVRDLAANDTRFAQNVLDVTRDVRTDGGSAAFRRFWLLTQDTDGTRTIVELKELGTPGTEFGRHSRTIDGGDRFDVLKPYWWDSADPGDHFTVYLLGGRFVARDRMIRTNPKPTKMTPDQITNMVQAEASLLALRHRKAWGNVKSGALSDWLEASAATLTARWRAAYTAAGGK